MKVLILAAGVGSRLGHDKPKALVKVAGLELIRHQLHFLQHPVISAIGAVGGFQFDDLAALVRKAAPRALLFENKNYRQGNILTLQAALPFLDDDFLLMNVDHIYPKKLLDRILKQVRGITACCDFNRLLTGDDMKIKKNDRSFLKAIDKKLTDYDGGYIGMTIVPRESITTYWSAFEKTLARRGPAASVEMILGELAAQGEPIAIADTSGFRWLEVDTPEDLKQAEARLKEGPLA